jgi:hypothetical protein
MAVDPGGPLLRAVFFFRRVVGFSSNGVTLVLFARRVASVNLPLSVGFTVA